MSGTCISAILDVNSHQRLMRTIWYGRMAQTVTIELPEEVFQQLVRVAQVTDQPVEVLVAQSVVGNLPPNVDHAPSDLRSDLLHLQSMSTEELIDICHSDASATQQGKHAELMQKQQSKSLAHGEQQELQELQSSAEHITLRKNYATEVLRWRGYRTVPLKETNELTL